MRHTFKTGQRIKRGVLRGTVLEVLKARGFTGRAARRSADCISQYIILLDNGAKVMGTGYQFVPAKRVSK